MNHMEVLCHLKLFYLKKNTTITVTISHSNTQMYENSLSKLDVQSKEKFFVYIDTSNYKICRKSLNPFNVT